MAFHQYIPTRLIVGKNCLKENASLVSYYGKKALIVTGSQSAKKTGALDHVLAVCEQQKIAHCIYDKILSNPTVENCYEGGRFAKENQADFIIAIGGGSPMDAAKAISVYAANEMEPMAIFDGNFKEKALPILAIPTTAGTGSEVTPYSILTVNKIENKKNFTSEDNFPKVAFLDAQYTESLPYHVTVDTVIDAMTHGIESILNTKTTKASELYALESLRMIGRKLASLSQNALTFADREDLLYASSLAGMAISHTGTVIVHSMGYCLTYYKDIPHGRANGMLMPGFLDMAEQYVPDKVQKVVDALGASSVAALNQTITSLVPQNQILTDEESVNFAAKSIEAANVVLCPWDVTEEQELKIFRTLVPSS